MTAPGSTGSTGHEPNDLAGLARHYLKDLVYGANDGIITTFAVVAGVAGARLEPQIVLILGFANLLGDGFSMGASNFLSIRSEEAAREVAGQDPAEPFPGRHSLATFLAFVGAGVIPLMSYVVVVNADHRFALAVTLTLATLFVVGAARALVTRARWWHSGAEMLVVGSVAAAVAYGVGAFVKGLTA